MRRETKSTLAATPALNPQTISTDTTTAGTAIDLKDYESCLFVLQSGAITDGTYTPLITESNDNSTYTAVADADLTNTEASTAYTAADDNKCKTIGYKGSNRYVKLSIVSASTSSGGKLGAVAIKGHPLVAPTPANG